MGRNMYISHKALLYGEMHLKTKRKCPSKAWVKIVKSKVVAVMVINLLMHRVIINISIIAAIHGRHL